MRRISAASGRTRRAGSFAVSWRRPDCSWPATGASTACRDAIDRSIEDTHIGYEAMKRLLANVRLFEVANEVGSSEMHP